MAARKYKAAKEKKKTVNEPQGVYSKAGKESIGSITISTITEQEESNYRYWLSLTPEERWAEHYKLLKRVYGIKNKPSDNRIIFD
jgi:hypothetical protein